MQYDSLSISEMWILLAGMEEAGAGGDDKNNYKPTNPHGVWAVFHVNVKLDPDHMPCSVPARSTVDMSPSKLVGSFATVKCLDKVSYIRWYRFNDGVRVRQGGTTKASSYTTQAKLSLKGIEVLLVKPIDVGCLSLFPIVLLGWCEQNKLFHCHFELKLSLNVMWEYGTLQMQIAALWL